MSEQLKKESKVKKAWTKVKTVLKKVGTWIVDNIEGIAMVTWGIVVLLWTFILGWISGLTNKDNNKANYDAGKRDGWNRGYADAVKDVESNGYTVYGGYGENASKMILTKTEEVNVKTEE